MKEAINPPAAAQPIGPYSQAIRSGEWLFLSGQIPLDPVSGALVEGDAARQAEQALNNVGTLLAAAGARFDHIVKVTLYLADMADFPAVNAVYAGFFQPPYPARATVQVGALPKGARVEIDATARIP